MTVQTTAVGGVRVVTGEPGCGRTTFLARAAHSLPAASVSAVRMRADPAAPAVPLGGLRTLLLALGAPAEPWPPAGPACAVLLDALRAASARTPVLVCVDDAHLWDAPTRAALGAVAEQLHGNVRVDMLLSVAGHRPVDREFAALPVVRVDPLSPAEAAALLDEATDGAVDRAVRDDLVNAAEGSPALLLAMVRRLSPAQLRGHRRPPSPLADAELLTGLVGGLLTGFTPAQQDLLLTVAAAVLDADDTEDARIGLALARRAAAHLRVTRSGTEAAHPFEPLPAPPPAALPGALSGVLPGALPGVLHEAFEVPEVPEVLVLADGEVGFHSELLRRAVYAGARPERRRAVHRALAQTLEETGAAGPHALLHRARSAAAPGRGTAAELAAAAGDPGYPAPRGLRCAAYTLAAELAEDGARRAEWYTAAAEQALLGGRAHRALRLLDTARDSTSSPALRGRVELVRGTTVLYDGPVDEARASLLLAARLLAASAPWQAQTALLAAVDAAWAAGDAPGCLRTLGGWVGTPDADARPGARQSRDLRTDRPGPPGGAADAAEPPREGGRASGSAALHDYRTGVRALLEGRFPQAAEPLRRLVTDAEGGEGSAVVRAVGGPGSDVATQGAEDVRGSEGASAVWAVECALGTQSAESAAVVRAVQGAAGVHGVGSAAVVHGVGGAAGLRGAESAAAPWAVGGAERTQDAGSAPGAACVDEPETALRAAAAALLLGDLAAARRAGARALAAARVPGTSAAQGRAREYLAYAELRAGRHALARTHAEEGLRAAHRTGQRNTAAHHHAVLALAASIEGARDEVAEHAGAALAIARRHGLVQAATLAEWAAARADLGRGRPREAADRLGPLVRPGPRRGHFAVWMLAVPCFVEAAASSGRADDGVAEVAELVEEFARWAGFGADPQAPAQLLRCRALLAGADRPDALYRRALALHDAAGGGDFEHARTELLHGKWLRRRRRLSEARDRLGAALMGFERCGARAWADQARAELRAGGVAKGGGVSTEGLSGLTPQQLRIARCVAEGATNREVALTLSVSTRTVDYHLRKVFAALGLRSRVELVRMVEKAGQEG
ncbi:MULTISPECIES: LuxR C-terminal-related transcriptional regulator [unclassified Streptomyces]|uniref:LuxR C-terminal-related transcriptional regulator n=1 Tax=unclassified Streptomyces TaxID=2593676 RepID=UPI00383089A2